MLKVYDIGTDEAGRPWARLTDVNGMPVGEYRRQGRIKFIIALVLLALLACWSVWGQTSKPVIYDALGHAGKPAVIPGTLKMAVVPSFSHTGNLTPAMLEGRLDDPVMWRHVDKYVTPDAAAVCLNIEGEWEGQNIAPGYELESGVRRERYERAAALVLAVKAKYRRPVGCYFFPPVMWTQHDGPSDRYVEVIRQSRPLMEAVDFVCPSLYMAYSFGGDMRQWRLWSESVVERTRVEMSLTWDWRGHRRKPIYPFLAPVYEWGVEPKSLWGKSITKTRLAEQVAWCRANADGCVLWGGVEVHDGATPLPWALDMKTKQPGWDWVAEAVGSK